MAVNLKIVSQVVASGTPGPVGKSAYQIAVDNGFQGTESEWLKELHPFKGWFDSVSALEETHPTPSVGEYAYVKGATSSDPVKIYECSTEGSWSDSGRTVDTSGVQTFGSGEDVNDVNITGDVSDIVENNEKLPTAGAVAIALGHAEFSTGEKIKDVGIDDEPTAGSDNLVKSGGVYEQVYYDSNIIPIKSTNGFYGDDLVFHSGSTTWSGRIYNISDKQKEQNQGIRIVCAPRSNAYTSLVDGNENILWQSNNAGNFPKIILFEDYPTAAKLYVSSEKTINPDPNCALILSIKQAHDKLDNDVHVLTEAVEEINEETTSNEQRLDGIKYINLFSENDIVQSRYYKEDLSVGSSDDYVRVSPIDISNYTVITLYAKIAGIAAISITDEDLGVIWQLTVDNVPSDGITNIDLTQLSNPKYLYFCNRITEIPANECYAKAIDNLNYESFKQNVLNELDEHETTILRNTNDILKLQSEITIEGTDLNPISINSGFYSQNLDYSSNSAWNGVLYNITDEQKNKNKGIYIDAAPRSNAYVSITDINDNILWQSNKANDFPRTILFEDYPLISKIYLSNEIAIKTYKTIFITDAGNAISELKVETQGLGNNITKLSEELSKAFFSNKLHSNNYDSNRKVTLPSWFQDYTIPIDISRNDNIFGWSTDVKKMQKNNSNTATYYCSPDGNDDNSGLIVSAPLKTLDAALSKVDLNTLILLPGTYICNEHFTSNLQVQSEINIIGIGYVELKCNSSSEYPLYILRPCYVENIIFNGGNGSLNVKLDELSDNKICVFYRCKFINSHNTNGLNALGGAYYLEECEASNNTRDGFNYHNNTDSGSILTRVIEINCCGYFNGLNHNSYINNGSTMHDGGRIIRIYCEYGSCKGSVVADATKTKTLNIGVVAYSTANIDGELDSQKANFAAQQGGSSSNPQIFYMVQCSSFGSLFDIYADNNATIYRDTHFAREGVNGTAVIVDYDLQ